MNPSKAILFVATSSNVTPRGGRTRIVDVAIETKKRQFIPYILCFVYGTQMLAGYRFLARGRARLEADAGCPVFYMPMLPFTRFVWLDWLNNWFCGFVISLVCWRFKLGTVYGHGIKAGHFGLFARKMSRVIRVVTDAQGLVTEEYLYSQGLTISDGIAKRMAAYEIETIKYSDWLIFVSHAMRAHYENKQAKEINNCTVIPCATRSSFSFDKTHRDFLRHEQGFADKLLVCYAGSAGEYHLPKQMCGLFKKILEKIPNSFFLVFSHDISMFECFLHAEGISTSSYKILSVPHAQIFEHLQMADVGLLLRDDSLVNQMASPTKFAEYCLCGLPVLTTSFVGDFSGLVSQFEIGHLVDLTHLTVNDELLSFFADVQEKRMEYAARSSRFSREYLTWDTYGPKLAEIFLNL